MQRWRLRSTIVAAAAVAAVTASTSPAPAAEAETETAAAAEAASFTGTVDNDSSTPAPKTLKFLLDVSTPGQITATLDWGATANLNLQVKNAAGTTVAATYSKTARPERLTFTASTTGRYGLVVIAATGGSAFTLDTTTATSSGPVFVKSIGGPAHPEVAPSGLDVDPSGNVYAADTANDEVVKYGPGGGVLWRKGERDTKRNGNFSNPRDTAFLDGKVYVADTGFNRVQVLDAATGNHLATWGARFSANLGISAGVDGNGAPIVLVSDSTEHKVKIFSPAGVLLRSFGSLGAGNGQFNQVRDAATDAVGNVYTADFKNQRVQVLRPDGSFLRAWGIKCPGTCPDPTPGQFKEPYGIQLDDAGNVYVSDNRRIQKFTSTGGYLRSYGVSGDGPDELFQLRRVALGPGTSPEVYAADLWGYKIQKFTQAGSLTKTFGGTKPPVTGFNQPYGLSVNGDTLYVADTNNQRIQRFSVSSGQNTGTFGGRGFGATNLGGENWPRGVTYNATTGTIWVADTKNYRAVELTTSGAPTGRVFGTTGSVLRPDVLNWVYGITSYGKDVIVADTFGNKIGRWTGDDPDTPVWTFTGVSGPKGVAVLGGVVYVADSLNRRVLLLDADNGSLLKTLTHPDLQRLEGIAVEPDGDIWVSDAPKNAVRQLSPSGQILQTYGGFGSANGKFNLPTALTVTGTGSAMRLFVTDSNNDRVQVLDIG